MRISEALPNSLSAVLAAPDAAGRSMQRERKIGRVISDSLQVWLLTVEFDDNGLLPQLFGDHNVHIARIEQTLDISLSSRVMPSPFSAIIILLL